MFRSSNQIRFWRTATGAALMMLCAAAASAQETTGGAVLRLKFRDSETGLGVVPRAVIVDGTIHHPGGRGATDEMKLELTEGDHQVTVSADGFRDLTSRQTAFPDDEAPLNVISLDPAEQPFEFRESTLRSYIPAGGSIIAGFVVDDLTGKPIRDAVVAMAGVTTRTSERGFFVLPTTLPDAQKLSEDDGSGTTFSRRGFSIFKPGYGPVERRNVLLMVGIPKTFRIRLTEGTTPDIEDEEENRGNLPASTLGFPSGGDHAGHNH